MRLFSKIQGYIRLYSPVWSSSCVEELHSWLHGEESDGQRVAETQTTDNKPSELPLEAAVTSPSPTQCGSLDFGLVSDQDADVESDVKEPSTSTIQPRRGL